MVKKNKELDKQFEYFVRKVSNKIADIGIGFGLILSMASFCAAMIGYYFVPFKNEDGKIGGFVLLDDLVNGTYAIINFIVEGLFNYVDNLPDFVKWCFLGFIAGIVIFFVFIMVFWQDLEEEEKTSDSEIWTSDEVKKERPDGMRIYQFSAKLISHVPLSRQTLVGLTEEIDYLFGENELSVDAKYEEITNEVSE